MTTTNIFYLSTFLCFILSSLCLEDSIVKVRLHEATMDDLSYNSYPVRFSLHRGTNFVKPRKGQWLFGILNSRVSNGKNHYTIEVPEIGRLMYTNPDNNHAVILDQVEYHHPSFVWTAKSSFNLEKFGGKNLIENLENEEFMYQTLIGDVRLKMEIKEIKKGKDSGYVRALRFNAPRKKVVREILRYKNFL